jgi:hypothetical protein
MVPFILGSSVPILEDVLAQAGIIGDPVSEGVTSEPGSGLPPA